MNISKTLLGIGLLIAMPLAAQQGNYVSEVWCPDQGNGTYKNPVLYADYSDPDACRVGDDFYLTASSFNCLPGLPILHSKDLVNWTIIGHAIPYALAPVETPEHPQHGNHVWAPAIRHHNGEFYIFWGDPDRGAFMVKAKDPKGPWSEPVLVKPAKGLIDTCPFWDEDGRVYMVHAYAGSRAEFKSVIAICELNAEATKAITPSRIIFDGHEAHETCEGPKIYKRGDYYYIFHPAGGVPTGWQVVLRSKNIYGPYRPGTRRHFRQRASSRSLGRHTCGRRLVLAFSRRRRLWPTGASPTHEVDRRMAGYRHRQGWRRMRRAGIDLSKAECRPYLPHLQPARE